MLKTLSLVDQVANHLKDEIRRGRWPDSMPGRKVLVKELEVNGSTVERAMAKLEKEGILESQGKGRPRLVRHSVLPLAPCTRVVIMLYEPADAYHALIVDLQHRLFESGHMVSFASRSLMELKHDPQRVLALLEKTPADAYVLVAASKPVLRGVLQLPAPVFAMFGRMAGLSIAGVGQNTRKALREAIDWLYKHGHERIVKLTRGENLQGELGSVERDFLSELEARGLPTGPYNLPYWENTPKGLHQCLEELFRVTPPTAIILDEWKLYYVVRNYLAAKRGQASRDAVCISMDYHDSFDWCRPRVPHFHCDQQKYVKRTVQWVNNMAGGKKDKRQTTIFAKFIDHGPLSTGAELVGEAP